METSNFMPADDDGEVSFRHNNLAQKEQGQADLRNLVPMGGTSHDHQAEATLPVTTGSSSFSSATFNYARSDTGSMRQSASSHLDDQSQTMSCLAGILKEVVTELRDLKQSLPVSCQGNDEVTRGGDQTAINAQCSLPLHVPQQRTHRSSLFQDVPASYSLSNTCTAGSNANYNSAMSFSGASQCRSSSMVQTAVGRAVSDNGNVYARANVKIPTFNGKEDWSVWIARFEAIAARYHWNDNDRLDQLLPRMEGQAAQFLFGQLPRAILGNYSELVQEMNSRFRVIQTSRSFAAKFSRRGQRAGETAEEFAADLKLLYDKAHGYRDRRTREEDLVRKFLDGLRDEEARFEVEFNKEPETLEEAVYHVVNFTQTRGISMHDRKNKYARRALSGEIEDSCADETVKRTPNSNDVGPVFSRSQENASANVNEQNRILADILSRLEKIEKRAEGARVSGAGSGRKQVECYRCHDFGHISRDCPQRSNVRTENSSAVRERQETRRDRSQTGSRPLNFRGPAPVARRGSN